MQLKMEAQSSDMVPPKSTKSVMQNIILSNPNKVKEKLSAEWATNGLLNGKNTRNLYDCGTRSLTNNLVWIWSNQEIITPDRNQ